MAIPTEPVGSLPRLVKLQAAIAAYDAMMILGFAGVGFMAYRRTAKPALMAA